MSGKHVRIVLSFLIGLSFLSVFRVHGQSQDGIAEKLVRQSLEATGGEAWRSVQTLSLEGYGYSQLIDQSERPEGPFIPETIKTSLVKDLVHHRALLTLSSQFYTNEITNSYVLDENELALKREGKLFPTRQDQMIQDEQFLAPENVLVYALTAKGLRFIKDSIVQQVPNAVLSFYWGAYPVQLLLNKETSFLTAVTVTKPYNDGFFAIWGDSRKTVYYSFWNFIGKGLHYPLQQDTYINGWYQSSCLINHWQVNAPVGADSLIIPDSIRVKNEAFIKKPKLTPQQTSAMPAKELAPGIWLLPGICNSTVIEQGDGIIVLEAPYSSRYGELLLLKIAQLFPGKKIKALVSTSDAWLHIGGARTFASLAGIRIYHPYRNRFILEKLLQADYHTYPDTFAIQPRHDYTLTGVKDSMVIGAGDNQLVLYLFATETGERQMMVYFPHRQLLYASDLYQPKSPDGTYWNPHIVWEVYHAVRERKLEVKQFYAMHTASVLPFSTLEDDFKE